MENLYVNENPELVYFPIVSFNYITGICEIAGESYMEEPYKFYQPVLKWLQDYSKENKPIDFIFKLSYFNTSSSRLILEIFEILKKHKESGGKVKVNWFYNINDPDMVGEIQGFESETGLDVNIIAIDKKPKA